MNTTELLRQLSEAAGISGYEDAARDAARDALQPYADSLHTDALGNLIALKRGTRPEGAPARSIMLAAHTDEIGLMVTGMDGTFIRFATVGGVDTRTLLGQEVTVYGARPLPGIVASRPPHVLPPEERKKPVPLVNLFIDIGMPAERVRELVHVGDLITLRRDFIELAEGYVSGKAFDDRAGVVSLVGCLEALCQVRHEWDVYAVATSQEEVGLRGATTSAYGVNPDIAIAVDVTFGAQPGVSDDETCTMGGGPVIARGPNIHPIMHEQLVSLAREHELPHQIEAMGGATGTDAWAIQVARSGIPTGLLSIPLRYMHTSVETVCVKDIERTGRLMALFIASLNQEFAAKLGL
ncbi:MAG: M42 family metallopeptidase [Chloroflexi bacterium]|jgi:putative aminopeptidase FrvX|nr:M42 family metallopeptidase [Chloroflexota bacterium]